MKLQRKTIDADKTDWLGKIPGEQAREISKILAAKDAPEWKDKPRDVRLRNSRGGVAVPMDNQITSVKWCENCGRAFETVNPDAVGGRKLCRRCHWEKVARDGYKPLIPGTQKRRRARAR